MEISNDSMNDSATRSLEYASRICSDNNEGVYIVYDSNTTSQTVNEFYVENGTDYNYIYFEWEDSCYCFETNGYIPLDYESFLKDFNEYSNVIDVSKDCYEYERYSNGFYFILRSDKNKLIFNIQKEKKTEPIRLEIIPDRLILLRSFPIKENKIDTERYFEKKIRYHNGKVYPKVSIGYCNELYWVFVLKKGSNSYMIKEKLDPDSLTHLNEILGEKKASFLMFNFRQEKVKEIPTRPKSKDRNYTVQIGCFKLIFNKTQVTYQYRNDILAIVDYDDVSIFSIIDDQMFCMQYGYRVQKNVEKLLKDIKTVGSDIRLYGKDFKAVNQLQLNDILFHYLPATKKEINDMEEGAEKDMVLAYSQFKKKDDLCVDDLSVIDLFDFFTNLKLVQYGFDSPLGALLKSAFGELSECDSEDYSDN